MKISTLGIGLVLIGCVGCNTVRTTFLKQDSTGQIVKDSRHFKKGLPVMLNVPTHVDVRIVQTDFWKKTGDELVLIPQATSRTPQIDPIFTEQMFLIDPKRPAEGTGQFAFDFHTADGKSTGTLSSVKYKADDNTLTATADLIAATVGTFSGPAKKTALGSQSKLVGNTRTIALKRFPVGEAYYPKIQSFIESYINGCASETCQNSPSYALPPANKK